MDLAEKLTTEGQRALAFFSALTKEQWNTPIYTEGNTWTVRSVLAHFVTAERGFLKLFAGVAQGGPGASEDFDLERYNASNQQKTADFTPAQLLQEFEQNRSQMAALAASFSPEDLQRRARHPALGVTTLEEMVKMVYLHNSMHLRDIKKTLQA